MESKILENIKVKVSEDKSQLQAEYHIMSYAPMPKWDSDISDEDKISTLDEIKESIRIHLMDMILKKAIPYMLEQSSDDVTNICPHPKVIPSRVYTRYNDEIIEEDKVLLIMHSRTPWRLLLELAKERDNRLESKAIVSS